MSSLCRRAGAIAAPVLVACLIGALLLPERAAAQSDVTRADLERALAQIEELKARIDKLEGGAEGLQFTAPFTVVGASGQTILTVDEEGGRPRLVVGTPDGRGIELAAGSQTESGTGIVVKDGSREIELTIDSEGAALKLNEGGGSEVTLGAFKGGASGLAVSLNGADVVVARSVGQGAGEVVVGGDEGQQATLSGSTDKGSLEIGQEEGLRARLSVEQETAELLLGSGGGAQARLTQDSDSGELLLGTEEGPQARLTQDSEGGELLLGKESTKHIHLDADNQHATITATDGDKEAWLEAGSATGAFIKTSEGEIELGKGQQGWGLVMTMTGQLAAGLSTLEGRGLALRLYDQGKMVAAMGPSPEGEGGTVRIYAGGTGAVATLNALNGSGVIAAYRADGSAAAVLDGDEQAVAVYNSGGSPIASLSASSHGSGGNVTARNGSGEGVFSAGAASDGGGEACVFRNTQNTFCLGMGLPGMGIGK